MNNPFFKAFQIPTVVKWGKAFEQRIIDRTNKRLRNRSERANAVVNGRTVPTLSEVAIGSGSRCNVAVMFLDVCGFSALPSWTEEEQQAVLAKMDLFMSEMIAIVREFSGHFEKNTGDGLMAYFGEACRTDAERVKTAVDAALVMHYFNDVHLGPYFDGIGISRLTFRIGIDVGPVMLAKIGVKSFAQNFSSLVAIGTTANMACKMMQLIPSGGICLGDFAAITLPGPWKAQCTDRGQCSTFAHIPSSAPYHGWELRYRLSSPTT